MKEHMTLCTIVNASNPGIDFIEPNLKGEMSYEHQK